MEAYFIRGLHFLDMGAGVFPPLADFSLLIRVVLNGPERSRSSPQVVRW